MKKHTTIYLINNPGYGWGDSSTGYILTDDPSSNGAVKEVLVRKNKYGLDVTILTGGTHGEWMDIFIPYLSVKGIIRK